jgi:glyoxylase I family protein
VTVPTSVSIQTSGVHHIALRVSDYARARKFYVETLGFPILLEVPNLLIFAAGNTGIAVRAPDAQTQAGDRFDPFRVGLDHIALGCSDESELARVASALTEAGIENTGVKLDEALGKRYVAFKDPDRIAWELYMV